MSILFETKYVGRIEAILINDNPDWSIASRRIGEAGLTFAGLPGDTHYGETRGACVRFKNQYPRGTTVRNTRQLSIVSIEELALIADAMGLASIEPEWLGANVLISGIPHFTLLPPSSRLLLPSGAGIVVDQENKPCELPMDVIEEVHPGRSKGFVKAANYRRGVTGWVEREGAMQVGDTVRLHVPRAKAHPELSPVPERIPADDKVPAEL